MFVLTTLAKINQTRLKFSQESVTILQKTANYDEARVKLRNSQLSKLKFTAKYKTGTVLRITKKNFQELPHELFLTTRQTTKIRITFTNNILAVIKLSKA